MRILSRYILKEIFAYSLLGLLIFTFIIFVRPEEGIGFPISLKGFREGFDKLP